MTSLIAQIGGEAEYKLVRAEDYEEELKSKIMICAFPDQSYWRPFDYALGLLEYELIDNLSVSATQRTILTEGRMKQALMLEEEQGLKLAICRLSTIYFQNFPISFALPQPCCGIVTSKEF